MKRFLPLYRHLLPVKWPFLIGVLCGLIYAVASGAGLPVMADTVFPLIFDGVPEGGFGLEVSIPSWIESWLPIEGGLNASLASFDLWLQALSPKHLLFLACMGIPAVFLVRALAGYFNSYLIQYSGQRVLEEIRIDMFAKLQSLPLSFFKKNRSGDLLSRLMGDTGILQQVLVNCSSDLIKQPVTLIAAISVLVFKSFKSQSFFAAMIALFTVPICVWVIRSAGKRLAAKARVLQAKGGTLAAVLTESLQSSLEIRAYNLEKRQVSQFRERIGEMIRLTLKVAKYRLAISPSIEFVASLGIAAALFMGVSSGMTLNEFIVLGMALYMSYEPIKKLGTVHALFSQGAASLERMEYILNQPDVEPEPEHPTKIGKPMQSIRFDDLSFAYDKEMVLKDVNVEIPIGQVVALIGPSGAGKSTFANLVPRFYDPTKGRITLDGVDLRDIKKSDLRDQIAVVPQMPSLFAGTVADNIRIGKFDASQKDIEDAAKRAFADDFIGKLPKGYETEVGERGDQLSGGQRQRIAIARAFLRDAPLLILDEATSALDADSEAAVQQALAELVKGRTTFIIAHRFSTIKVADRVLVFRRGSIVADGTHDQLRESNPIYQAMAAGHVM